MKQTNIYDFVPKPTRKTKFTNLIKARKHYDERNTKWDKENERRTLSIKGDSNTQDD